MSQALEAEWRLSGGPLALRLLPVVACVLVAIWALDRAAQRSEADGTYTALSVEALVLGAGLLVVVLRTRVRVLGTGVEVRELRTRTYVWTDIRWVEPTRGHRAVRLGFRDGSTRTLPVPRRLRPGLADRVIDGCVSAVLRHAPHGR